MLSIIVPAYNAEQTIEHTLLSTCALTNCDMEIIVVDDGSTDSTNAIVKKLASTDQRIRLITQRNFGRSHARNTGFSASRGTWIMFLDSDDYLLPEGIPAITPAMDTANSSIDLVIFPFIHSGRNNMVGYSRSVKWKHQQRVCKDITISAEDLKNFLFNKQNCLSRNQLRSLELIDISSIWSRLYRRKSIESMLAARKTYTRNNITLNDENPRNSDERTDISSFNNNTALSNNSHDNSHDTSDQKSSKSTDNRGPFNTQLRFSEDRLFNCEYLSVNKEAKIVLTGCPLYFWNIEKSGTCSVIQPQDALCLLPYLDALDTLVDCGTINKEDRNDAASSDIYFQFYRSCHLKGEDLKEAQLVWKSLVSEPRIKEILAHFPINTLKDCIQRKIPLSLLRSKCIKLAMQSQQLQLKIKKTL